MYNQTEVEKKERRKIIVAATISVAVILILIVAIIVVATKKSSRGNSISSSENTAFEIAESEDKKSSETVSEEVASEAAPEEETETEVFGEEFETTDATETTKRSDSAIGAITTEKDTDTEISNVSNMPSTGPEEILPIALVAGALVMYLSSKILAKREA